MNSNLKLQQMVDSMIDAGVPRQSAVAIATSIEHSITSSDYATRYGTFMVDTLKDFVNTVEAVA